MLKENIHRLAWDSMGTRQIPIFREGESYTVRIRQAIFNRAICIRNNGSQILLKYRIDGSDKDGGSSVVQGVMISDVFNARRLS